MSLVDIGANFSHRAFREGLGSVLEYAAKESDVTRYIVTTSNLKQLPENIFLCEHHTSEDVMVRCTVGIHPHNAKTFDGNSVRTMRRACKNSNVKAIGETGLDYNRMLSSKREQLESFEAHVVLACNLNKPLFLHEREAHRDFVDILDKHRAYLPGVVVHCFTGSAKEAQEYINRNFYIGITGIVAMEKRGAELRAMLSRGDIPLDKIMVESDCPYMVPDGGHGMLLQPRRNEPVTLVVTVKTIASCLKVPHRLVKQITTENAIAFFGLP